MKEPTPQEVRESIYQQRLEDKKDNDRFRRELKEEVIKTINLTVNGKIEKLSEKVDFKNEEQDEKLEEMHTDIKSLMAIKKGTTNFFTVTKTIAIWVTSVSAGGIAIWAFIRFVVMNAI